MFLMTKSSASLEFPSPCGVRRVRDGNRFRFPCCLWLRFPSPCGVRRVRDGCNRQIRKVVRKCLVSVPLRGKEGAGHSSLAAVPAGELVFPSPCGVRRVRDFRWNPKPG